MGNEVVNDVSGSNESGNVQTDSGRSALDAIENGEIETRPSLDDIESGNYTPKESKEPAKETKAAKIEPAVGATPPAPAEKKEGEEQAKKFKLKIDGAEVELSEAEVVKYAQMGKASMKRFEEAANMKRQVEPILKALKEDPYYLLTHPELGIDEGKFREATEKWLAEKIMFEALPPEQQELHALRKEKEKTAEYMKKQEEAKQQEAMAEMEQKYAADYERQFVDALEKVSVPKEPRVIARMADYMARALKTNTQLTAEDAALLVKEDLAREHSSVASRLTPEELINYIGKENADKVRKYFASQVKNVLLEEGTRGKDTDRKQPQSKGYKREEYTKYLDKLEGY